MAGDGGFSPPTVESKVRADIEALVSSHPMGEALAEMAIALAREMDAGVVCKACGGAVASPTAALNRELRANLIELASQAVADDDDLEARLSAPVRDPEES